MTDIQYIDPDALLRISPLVQSLPELDEALPKLDLPPDGIEWEYLMHHDGRYCLKARNIKRAFACTHGECSSRWLALSLTDKRFIDANVHTRPYRSVAAPDVADTTVCLRLSRYRAYIKTETLATTTNDDTSTAQQELEQLLQRKTSQLGVIDLAALVRQAVQDGLIKPTSAYEPGQKTEPSA